MIHMIALDLDGTLLAGKSILPEENILALRRAMDAGVKLVIASGRMLESTLPIAEKIGVNAPMTLFNGSMVYDRSTDRVLDGKVIERDTARALIRAIEARGGYVQAFPGRNFYFEKRCGWTDYYEDKIGVRGIELGRPLSDWLETDVYKLLCLGEGPELEALSQFLAPRFPDISFMKSSQTHLEIILKGVDKADGLRRVCEITGIEASDVLAFGDEENDLSMLLYAGTGYAMENGPESVRRQAKFIAPKNTECGVSKIVNLYLNEGRMGG